MPGTQSPWLFTNLKANPRVAIRFGCTTALSQAPMEGGHRKTTPPLQQELWDLANGHIQKKLKGVLRNQTSSETSLEFFLKCFPILHFCKPLNHLGNKVEVMWCQYDQVLVASDISLIFISPNIYGRIRPGNLTWDHYQQWWLGKCMSFQILQIVGIYVKFPGGWGYAPQKNKKVLQQRWIF